MGAPARCNGVLPKKSGTMGEGGKNCTTWSRVWFGFGVAAIPSLLVFGGAWVLVLGPVVGGWLMRWWFWGVACLRGGALLAAKPVRY